MSIQTNPSAASRPNRHISSFSSNLQSLRMTDESAASITDLLVDQLADGSELLTEQFEHVVRELVSLSAHAAQLHRRQVRVGRPVRPRAVHFVQSEPEGVRIHLDQVSENTAGRGSKAHASGISDQPQLNTILDIIKTHCVLPAPAHLHLLHLKNVKSQLIQ